MRTTNNNMGTKRMHSLTSMYFSCVSSSWCLGHETVTFVGGIKAFLSTASIKNTQIARKMKNRKHNRVFLTFSGVTSS